MAILHPVSERSRQLSVSTTYIIHFFEKSKERIDSRGEGKVVMCVSESKVSQLPDGGKTGDNDASIGCMLQTACIMSW